MPGINLPQGYRLLIAAPFTRLGIEGATSYSASDLIKIYREVGKIPIDFGAVRKWSYCDFFEFGIYAPDVCIGTYAKFYGFTKRNPDSIIITGLGNTVLETMTTFIDDLKRVTRLEVREPTNDFADDMKGSQFYGLVEDTTCMQPQQRMDQFMESCKSVIHK